MPGINLLEIRKLCEEKLLESGADSFWYWDVGAFVFSGDETTVSISGKQYVTSDKEIENNDIIIEICINNPIDYTYKIYN